ncbi:SDR family oxidoreductase [Pantoea cypripedii]|uniref:Short-chain dehydrogenase/reductase n=1 Tax=Pantoea cypripedii TaxID=55209 RepID=A0A1X1EKL0_PANCY|nr:SDR family oxidoreductase [Pantoea cypripedii]MBP2199001.1 NAD(P)-dependent dehydrogenase (short-subunit alcohol dehydrogenase family) [Pantoea cypripedii]ORM89426.1 short-chain dehydrogenase/reductase [Pantoea cypripedii]
MTTNKIWLVTGASKGLGLTLTKQLLAAGHKVVATSRSKAGLEKAIGPVSSKFLPLTVDLTNEESVKEAVTEALSHFGHIDVIINNAGFGQTGTIEELSDAEVRNAFDVNVFGMFNVIRAVMPHLRHRRNGQIINISSMAGIKGYIPGWGAYCAAKFAVAGLTEALAAEVKDFSIKVTLVYPGHMRTSFLSDGSVMLPQNPLAEYTSVRKNEEAAKQEMNGHQMGDPEKAAALLIQLHEMDAPPLHYFLGEDVYKAASEKIQVLQESLEEFKSDTLSIGF